MYGRRTSKANKWLIFYQIFIIMQGSGGEYATLMILSSSPKMSLSSKRVCTSLHFSLKPQANHKYTIAQRNVSCYWLSHSRTNDFSHWWLMHCIKGLHPLNVHQLHSWTPWSTLLVNQRLFMVVARFATTWTVQ